MLHNESISSNFFDFISNLEELEFITEMMSYINTMFDQYSKCDKILILERNLNQLVRILHLHIESNKNII